MIDIIAIIIAGLITCLAIYLEEKIMQRLTGKGALQAIYDEAKEYSEKMRKLRNGMGDEKIWKKCENCIHFYISSNDGTVCHKNFEKYRLSTKIKPDDFCDDFATTKQSDTIHHPSHYETGKYECIDVMLETQGIEAVKSFCICNAFKYIYRHNGKNGLEDIKKAKTYLDWYIQLCENGEINKK